MAQNVTSKKLDSEVSEQDSVYEADKNTPHFNLNQSHYEQDITTKTHVHYWVWTRSKASRVRPCSPCPKSRWLRTGSALRNRKWRLWTPRSLGVGRNPCFREWFFELKRNQFSVCHEPKKLSKKHIYFRAWLYKRDLKKFWKFGRYSRLPRKKINSRNKIRTFQVTEGRISHKLRLRFRQTHKIAREAQHTDAKRALNIDSETTLWFLHQELLEKVAQTSDSISSDDVPLQMIRWIELNDRKDPPLRSLCQNGFHRQLSIQTKLRLKRKEFQNSCRIPHNFFLFKNLNLSTRVSVKSKNIRTDRIAS